MFKEIIVMYFSSYIWISILIFGMYCISTKYAVIDFDIHEKLKEIYEQIQEIRLKNETTANFLESFINLSLEGDKTKVFILIFALCLFPIIRILILLAAIQSLIKYFKSNS